MSLFPTAYLCCKGEMGLGEDFGASSAHSGRMLIRGEVSLFSLQLLPSGPQCGFDSLAQPAGLPAACIIPRPQPFSLPSAKLAFPLSQSLSLKTPLMTAGQLPA